MKPIDGLRVLEFTQAVMGPSAGLILADLGAEVIRVEPPGGDPTRRLKGMGTGYFPFYNRNKKSITLDLKSKEGSRTAKKLIGQSDVIVENFAPGTMKRLGLGYEDLKDAHEGLIYCSLKGFLSGPYENRLAMDEVVQMMSGLAYMTGPEGRPLRAGTSIIDICGGMFGVIGILAAVLERQKTGQGQLVKASLYETAVFTMGQHMAYSALTNDGPIPPMPNRVSAWSIYQIFSCRDGAPLFVGIISDQQWQRFVQCLEMSDLEVRDELATNNGRIEAKSWLIPRVAEGIALYDRAELMRRLDAAQIPYAPISTPEDLFEDPHLNHGKGLLDTKIHDDIVAKLPGLPLEMGGRRTALHAQPPQIGEHSVEILNRLLGRDG